MSVPPYTGIKLAFTFGHQDLVGLRELRCAQAVKGKVEMDLKSASFSALLSHAVVARRETLAARG
jgi:hypothetical protein